MIILFDANNLFYKVFYIHTYQGRTFADLRKIFFINFYSILKQIKLQCKISNLNNRRIFLIWDSKKSWRQNVFLPYKQNRSHFGDDLEQLKKFIKFRQSLKKIIYNHTGYRQIEIQNLECDDIIAYMVRTRPNKQIIIVSGDRDFYQLLSDNVFIFKSHKGRYQLYTNKEFQREYELDPSQWVDVKCLMGDSSDNIKGVPGIGEKSALKFIRQYGSLFKIFGEKSDNIWIEKIKENFSDLLLYRRLMNLRINSSGKEISLLENIYQ